MKQVYIHGHFYDWFSTGLDAQVPLRERELATFRHQLQLNSQRALQQARGCQRGGDAVTKLQQRGCDLGRAPLRIRSSQIPQ